MKFSKLVDKTEPKLPIIAELTVMSWVLLLCLAWLLLRALS